MKTVAVVIPIYKNELNSLEKISLEQTHKILNEYDIFYVEPKSLSFIGNNHAIIKRFDDQYFKSVRSYNRLLLDMDFYSTFSEYRYILICQLDVFIFSDQLKDFCKLGYDYYGAPWINGIPINAGKGIKIRFVGNGGLSLRNVQKTINLLRKYEKYAKSYNKNEDFFFSYFRSKDYRVAPANVSLAFCIETHVQKCMRMNRNKLPFGTHAWERYDFDYWRRFIENYGYDLSNLDLDKIKKNEDFYIKKGLLRKALAYILRSIDDKIIR